MRAFPTEPMMFCTHFLVDSPGVGPRPRRDARPSARAPYQEIVACVDGSELGKGVVSHAEAVARALGARLTLVHVLESVGGAGAAPEDPLDWSIRRSEARALLAGLGKQVARQDATSEIRSEVLQGKAAEQICRWNEQHGVDLTVLCSHGASGVTDWCLASTARQLVESVPGSFMLVPASSEVPGAPVRYERILVPLDGSARAESVLPVAMRIAAAEHAEVVLAHVVPVPEITQTGVLDAEGIELGRRVTAHNERVANDYLERIRARITRPGVRVRTVVAGDGNVRTDLGRLIREEQAGLVVMSAHGRTGRTDAALGSVAEHVVTHTHAPLLVVREQGRPKLRRVGWRAAASRERSGPSVDATP